MKIKMKTWIILLVIFCSLLGGLGQIFLKLGMDNFNLKNIITNFPLIIGISLYGVAFILYNFALRFEKVTLVYSLIALSYIWIFIFAWLILNEQTPYYKIIGGFIIVLGVFIIHI